VFAITGLIGSGKSFVSSVIREAGFEVLDADALVHELYKKDAELRKKIAQEFGDEAINENGINRKFVSNLVFNDPQKLELLENFVYPVLQNEIEEINPVFVEAAVLYKCPELAKKMKEIWVVEASEDLRKKRLLERGLARSDVENRMRVQGVESREWRVESCVERIDNNGTREECKDKVLKLLQKHIPNTIQMDIPLKKHTTFKIGGNAKFFAEPKDIEEIRTLLAWCGEFKIEYFVLGKGSNVLFDDEGYGGVVIKLGGFYAGNSLHSLIQNAANHGLGGLEKLEGIPGTIGGAIFMNAGAHGQQISDCIKSVASITANGEITTRTKEECEFSYRSSIFKKLSTPIILSAEFNFIPMPKETITKNRKEVLAWRKAKQPLQYPNAGSVFKNPANNLSAGALIESCNLKGFSIGDAQVSELHANFIVNKGSATAKDVKSLMEKIAQSVKKTHGVELEAEIMVI
jgi:UDP-N-acetylmuramate dehydrogenase